jgi:hypothetical protein
VDREGGRSEEFRLRSKFYQDSAKLELGQQHNDNTGAQHAAYTLPNHNNLERHSHHNLRHTQHHDILLRAHMRWHHHDHRTRRIHANAVTACECRHCRQRAVRDIQVLRARVRVRPDSFSAGAGYECGGLGSDGVCADGWDFVNCLMGLVWKCANEV